MREQMVGEGISRQLNHGPSIPETTLDGPEDAVPMQAQLLFKVMSGDVELDEDVDLIGATKKAQEASVALGSEVVVSVLQGTVIKAQYCEGRHMGPSKDPVKKAPARATARESTVKKVPAKTTKPNGKVTSIDTKPKPTKAEKQVALGKATKATPAPKPSKAAKELPLCKCGCGERTKGGTFRPGHDARYYSAQAKAGKGGHTQAKAAKK